MKEGSYHLFFTFPSIPSKTHPPEKKKCQEDCSLIFIFQRFLNKKIVINSVYVLFPPDLENFKLKGVGTFTPIPFFHT